MGDHDPSVDVQNVPDRRNPAQRTHVICSMYISMHIYECIVAFTHVPCVMRSMNSKSSCASIYMKMHVALCFAHRVDFDRRAARSQAVYLHVSSSYLGIRFGPPQKKREPNRVSCTLTLSCSGYTNSPDASRDGRLTKFDVWPATKARCTVTPLWSIRSAPAPARPLWTIRFADLFTCSMFLIQPRFREERMMLCWRLACVEPARDD